MFCARGGVIVGEGRKEDCLCERCELFKKFRLEGDYFCQLKEEKDISERSPVPQNICTDFQTSAGKIRVCVLDKQK